MSLELIEWLIKSKRISKTKVCPNCRETFVSETFMRFDCLNPNCKFFQKYLAEKWIRAVRSNPPYFDSILFDKHSNGQSVWKNATYLDLWVCRKTNTIWDLWLATWWAGAMVVSRNNDNRVSVEINDKDRWLIEGDNIIDHPQIVEALKRVGYLEKFNGMGIKPSGDA